MHNKSLQPMGCDLRFIARCAAAELNRYVASKAILFALAASVFVSVDVIAHSNKTAVETELILELNEVESRLKVVEAAGRADQIVLATSTYSEYKNDKTGEIREIIFEVTQVLKGEASNTISVRTDGYELVITSGIYCARPFNELSTVRFGKEYVIYMSEGSIIRIADFDRRGCELSLKDELKLVSRFLKENEELESFRQSLDND